MPKSAKLFRRSLQKSGVFFTPKKLAEYMRSFFPKDVPEIYDPTCGDGGLLAVFEGARKYGQEIDEEQGNYEAAMERANEIKPVEEDFEMMRKIGW